eukprot:TRINITY_DN9707_c0_g1_i1.p1 TRINITY_DN9707_c0_g1~~TRINITY_DN9707_c0_g1_i1.p1  ORF type:complete len:202 (+),score=22.99 TRINITY_DN9707_c0_g1_i1:63-668(+)
MASKLSVNTEAGLVTAGISAFYLVGYSGYDKATRSMQVSKKLTHIFSFSNTSESLLQLNKLLGLVGCTVLAAATAGDAPHVEVGGLLRRAAPSLRAHALAMLGLHGLYSSWRFSKFIGAASKKGAGMAIGSTAVASLFAANFGNVSRDTVSKLLPAAMVAGVTHFYLMETGPKGLQIRPAGYAAFIAAGVALAISGIAALR